MARRFVAGLTVAAALAVAAQAADVPYTVLLDGRPLTPRATGTGAIARNGVVFVDVVVATKSFSGLLTFADAGNTVRLSIQHATVIFRVGSRTAQFDGKARRLPGIPFKEGGDLYVPLSTVATLGGATLKVDARHQIARLSVHPFAPAPPVAARTAAPAPAPPPVTAPALVLTPSTSIDVQGALHVRLDVANTSVVPVSLEFPNGGRVAFAVSRDGTIVWDSTRGLVFPMIVGFVTVPPKQKLSFDGVWPQYGAQPAGRYQLIARLLTRSPLVSPAVTVPPAPHPAP